MTPKQDLHSGYANRALARAYTVGSPLYDPVTWWMLLPLGGERAARREFVRWLDLAPGLNVASLCCGTGSMERVMLAEEPTLVITGVDLAREQIAQARRKNAGHGATFIQGDAARTGLDSESFDRVLIVLALHEMLRTARLAVLREARRLCGPGGRVLAIEHGRPTGRVTRLLRGLWWFHWIPGNPEVPTSRDLQSHGLDNEMRECDLKVIERHTTRPDWIEACSAVPASAADD